MQTILHKAGYFTPERAEELDRLAAQQAEKERRLAAAKLRAICGVLKRDQEAAFDRLEYVRQRLAAEQFQAYQRVHDELRQLLEWPGIIVLSGANGPGKTHLAAMLVHAFCDRGRAAFYCTALHYYRMLASTFDEPGRTQLDLYRRMHGYELLVIDELEVRPEKPWHENELRDLINARYGNVVSTVLITNKSPGQLVHSAEPYLSPAVRDRIADEGAVLPCNWPSLRGRSTR